MVADFLPCRRCFPYGYALFLINTDKSDDSGGRLSVIKYSIARGSPYHVPCFFETGVGLRLRIGQLTRLRGDEKGGAASVRVHQSGNRATGEGC